MAGTSPVDQEMHHPLLHSSHEKFFEWVFVYEKFLLFVCCCYRFFFLWPPLFPVQKTQEDLNTRTFKNVSVRLALLIPFNLR